MTSRLLVAGIHPKITDKWDYFDVKAELPKTPDDIAKAFGTTGRQHLQDGHALTSIRPAMRDVAGKGLAHRAVVTQQRMTPCSI